MTSKTMRLSALALLLPLSAGIARTGPSTLRFDRVQLKTGVELHYAWQGATNGETVILLHGYSDSWFSYSTVLRRLPANLRVYALDMRGHGKSSRPADGYSMNQLAADVVAFMDAKSIGRATIVGHSLGGLIAQRVAEAAPQRVARMVLVATATGGRKINGVEELHATVKSFTDSVPLSFIREFQLSTGFAPISKTFMARAIDESRRLPAYVWRALADGIVADDRPAYWPQVWIPTLVMWGDRDTYAPRSEQAAMVDLIPGARLKIYANTGHAVHWERSAEFTRDLVGFIANN